MSQNTQKTRALSRCWAIACSLKLAIALASAAALMIMTGSLIMHFNPEVFSGMEETTMSLWLTKSMVRSPLLVSWLPLSGLCVLLFAVNTMCCLLDWLCKIKTRWRKCGEYLVHTGFIMLVMAYLWGNLSGFRSEPQQIFQGETLAIAQMPGYSLHLEEFTPQLEPSGRPLDMINNVSLWKEEILLQRASVRINHPLIHDGLVILATSFGQELRGFRFHWTGHGLVELKSGSDLALSSGATLTVHNLLPDAQQDSKGRVLQTGSRLNNPAMLLSLSSPAGIRWQGWYFLRGPVPEPLVSQGLLLRPLEPIYATYSLLTINRDPGDKLAMAGALCMTIGTILSFFSFYRKRTYGDRPEL